MTSIRLPILLFCSIILAACTAARKQASVPSHLTRGVPSRLDAARKRVLRNPKNVHAIAELAYLVRASPTFDAKLTRALARAGLRDARLIPPILEKMRSPRAKTRAYYTWLLSYYRRLFSIAYGRSMRDPASVSGKRADIVAAIKRVMVDPDPEVARVGVQAALSWKISCTYVDQIRHALRSDTQKVRKLAIHAAARLRGCWKSILPVYKAAVLRSLEATPPDRRGGLASNLQWPKKIIWTEQFKRLARLAQETRNLSATRMIAAALARSSERGRRFLLGLARAERDPQRRLAIEVELARVGVKSAEKRIIRALAAVAPDRDRVLVGALQDNGSERARRALLRQVARTARGNPFPEALTALVKLQDPRAVPSVQRTLLHPIANAYTFRDAVEALKKYDARAAFDFLVAQFDASSPRTRRRAARALGLLGDKRAVAYLTRRQHDKDLGTRVHVLRALGRLAPELALGLATRGLNDPTERYRYWSTRILSDLARPSTTQALIKLVKRRKKGVDYTALQALGRIDDAAAIAALVKLAAHTNRSQSSARNALASSISRKRSRALFSAYLEHQNPTYRTLAVRMLGQYPNAADIDNIARRLRDNDAAVRRAACVALTARRTVHSMAAIFESGSCRH